LLQSIDPILGQNDLIALAHEQATGDLAHGQRIVDDHDGRQTGRFRDHGWQHRRHGGVHAGHRGSAGQRDRVEDQHNFAVTEHRGAGNTDDAGKLGADVLDDDFLVALELIDEDANPLRA